ncbi:MAG: SAM-dependent methyltransferase [Stutzerimonas stutzeri]|nr:MAG: SAM-dependent methyltransferase [Stutzerimonas stutzeri]
MLHLVPQGALEALHHATALYTVEPVCNTLLERIGWPSAAGRLLDPSAGDGMFLLCALSKLELGVDDLAGLSRVRGWEIYPPAVERGRQMITQHLTSRGWTIGYARLGASQVLKQGDFLLEGPTEPGYHFVAGNPPYLRFARLPDAFKRLYAHHLCDASKGDLLHAFLLRCSAVMEDDGVIGFVTSDRWLLNSTAATLRATLGTRVGVDHVSRLNAHTSFYRPKERRKGTPPRIHPVEIVLRSPARSSTPLTNAPLSPDGIDFDVAVQTRLGDVANVRLAPWLGPANIFVVDRSKAEPLPKEHLVPAVDTDDVDPKTDELSSPKRFAIRTGRHSRPPEPIVRHLEREMHRMPRRGIRKTPWLPPEKVFDDLSRPALLIPRIAKKVRAIHLPPGILPINHNLYVVQAREDVSLERIEAALLSEATHEWLTRNAPRLENGYYDLRSSLIRRIPVTI